MSNLFTELRRRNVIRVAIVYVVVAWLILQVVDVVMPMLRLPEWVGGFTFLLLGIGFPIALIFAWAFEITPDGIKREKDVNRTESITHETGRRIDFIIIGLLVVAVGYLVVDKFLLRDEGDFRVAEGGVASIAVLPFVNMSADPDQEYFSDGISEELLNVLSKIPGLQVTARTSSFQFKGENRDIIDIGKQLNAALVLEGSVRKAGPQVRITAQLVDASNGFHLWSETYDRELENIFAVQDEISVAIVGALKEHLGLQVEAVPRAITANAEAYEAYLRGRHLVVQRQLAIEGAVREFEKAIMLDPDYALAHAELAIAILLLIRDQWGDLTVSEAVARAAPHAERAMTLDPTLAEAHAATGNLLWVQGKLEEALTHFEQAIQINPNYSVVYMWMGSILNDQLGRYAEAFAAHETALRLDPVFVPAIWNYMLALIDRNRLAEADREREKFASINPYGYLSARGFWTSMGGEWTNAVLANLDSIQIDPSPLSQQDRLS